MSKERALRREEREREAAVLAAARAAEAERRERRDARRAVVTSRLPMTRRRPRQTGILAERRRRQTGATIALLLLLNILVWLFVPEWSARAGALIVSILAAPVLHTMLFRRS